MSLVFRSSLPTISGIERTNKIQNAKGLLNEKTPPEIKVALVGAAMMTAVPAFAQNSVTLYGIVDIGFGYQSSSTSLGSTSGGHSAFKMINGVWAGSRFGLKGNLEACTV